MFEKEVVPAAVNAELDDLCRTLDVPKRILSGRPIKFTWSAAYEQYARVRDEAWRKTIQEAFAAKMQDIVIYPPPLFMFPKRMMAYRAKDIRRYKGYLSSFKPVGMVEGETPQMSFGFTLEPK